MQDHATVRVYALEIKNSKNSCKKDWLATWLNKL